MRRLLAPLVVCLLLPCILVIVSLGGYVSNYTATGLTPESFAAQYSQSIYRFRWLAPALMELLGPILPVAGISELLSPWGRNILMARHPGGEAIYAQLFLVNLLGMVLFAALFYRLFAGALPHAQLLAATVVQQLFIALTLYVVTPYDTLSYAALAATVGFQVQGRFLWSALSLVLGMQIRESVLLAIPILLALRGAPLLNREPSTRAIVQLALLGGFCYLALRLVLGGDLGWIHTPALLLDLIAPTPHTIVGAIAAATLLVLAYSLTPTALHRSLRILLLWSSPYILVVLLTGSWFELRLWVPLCLGALWLNILVQHKANRS